MKNTNENINNNNSDVEENTKEQVKNISESIRNNLETLNDIDNNQYYCRERSRESSNTSNISISQVEISNINSNKLNYFKSISPNKFISFDSSESLTTLDEY